MKRKVVIFLVFLSQIKIIEAQKTAYIPDEGFRSFIASKYPSFMKGDSLLVDSAATLKILNCSGENIHSLSGIEYFKNIWWLNCSDNKIDKTIDLSANDSLVYFDGYSNLFDSLPILSKKSSILRINVSFNKFDSIVETDTLPTLEKLDISWNKLTSLPSFFNYPNLKELDVSNNYLQTLPNLSHLTNIVFFNCQGNYLDFSVSREYEIIYKLPNMEIIMFTPQYAKDIKDTSIYKCPGDTFMISFPKQGLNVEYEWILNNDTKIDQTPEPEFLVEGFSVANGDTLNTYICNSVGYIWEKANKWNTSISTQRFSVGKIKVIAKKTEPVVFSGLDTIYCLQDKNIVFNVTPIGGAFYGQGIINDSFNPLFAGTGEHEISYIYNHPSGCKTIIKKTVKVKECDDITRVVDSKKNNRNKFIIFPNPCRDKLNIVIQDIPDGIIDLKIFDVSGRVLYKRHELSITNKFSEVIDIFHLANGLYYLEINTLSEKYCYKFAVKK